MKFLVFICLIIPITTIQSQEVESKSYQLMLKTLLSHTVPELSVSEVQEAQTITWLDARARGEYDISKIENAQWVGYDDFNLDRVEELPKDAEIVVYCSVGYRSEKVAEQLQEAGFTNVSNLYGGIFEWKNQGRAVVDSTESVTERVHAYSRTWGIWLKEGEKVYK